MRSLSAYDTIISPRDPNYAMKSLSIWDHYQFMRPLSVYETIISLWDHYQSKRPFLITLWNSSCTSIWDPSFSVNKTIPYVIIRPLSVYETIISLWDHYQSMRPLSVYDTLPCQSIRPFSAYIGLWAWLLQRLGFHQRQGQFSRIRLPSG